MFVNKGRRRQAGSTGLHVTESQLPLMSLGLCILLGGLSPKGRAAEELQADAAVLANVFGDTASAGNVAALRAEAAAMPPDERFYFLLQSVLPALGEGSIRMAGEFSQADPAPAAKVLPGRGNPAGGEVVSPVYDLLDVGREVRRLDEVLRRVQSLPESNDEFQQRARASLRLLLHMDLGDREAAEIAADELFRLVEASSATTIAEMWPETLAIYRIVHHHQTDHLVTDLLTSIFTRRSHAPLAGMDVWFAHLTALTQTLAARATNADLQPLEAPHGTQLWHPVSRSVARSRGIGYPQAVWMRHDRELHQVSGHDLDYLLYSSPLRGNYEVEADLYGAGVTQFMVAGRVLGMAAGGQGIVSGSFQNGTVVKPVEPHWGISTPWVRYRAVVRDGTLQVFLDGRQVHSEPLAADHDPWMGVHSGARGGARIRDIRITGHPEVPETVMLSASPELPGWLSYHDETMNVAGGAWRWEVDTQSSAGQIIARPDESLKGTFAESLLRYQRPLLEDGSITYEFFYQPGRAVAHPALDRLALLIQPPGVSLHWITDGRYDPTAIGPENRCVEPPCRRGPAQLPLEAEAWNQVKLSLTGEQVTLELNGTLIYERELESTNRRTFGLFRYADQELRVRKVVMRGDWPTSVPAMRDQLYADPAIAALDAGLPQLAERFEHDFAQEGLPERSFRMPPGKSVPQVGSSGVIHTESSADEGWAYSVIQPTVQMHGDFDVTLRYEDLQTPSANSGCGLGLFLGDKHMELIRRHGAPQVERVLTTFVTPMPSEGARHDGRDLTTEARAGSFRIVRRGDTIWALFADNDSSAYRVVAEHTWEKCGQLPATLDIRTMAHNRGRTQVTWSRFVVAAERLMRVPSATELSKPVVFTINADGTELKQLTQPMPQFVWHGSPEWSPDGKRIVFDAWTGRADTSHIYVMNEDGSEPVDLGVGIIPTFSPDGQRLAFTWSGHGTTIMNVDGTGREVLTSEGWGVQWSPDGRWIVYGSYSRVPDGNSAANLTVIDVATREKRALLVGDEAGRYTQVEWNMAWSPDSRQIVFKGHRREGAEVAIVSVDGSAAGFRVIADETISGNLGWHPTGRHVLLSKGGQLHEYHVETGDLRRLPGHPVEPANPGGVWDSTGERIVFVAIPKPEPVPWDP